MNKIKENLLNSIKEYDILRTTILQQTKEYLEDMSNWIFAKYPIEEIRIRGCNESNDEGGSYLSTNLETPDVVFKEIDLVMTDDGYYNKDGDGISEDYSSETEKHEKMYAQICQEFEPVETWAIEDLYGSYFTLIINAEGVSEDSY